MTAATAGITERALEIARHNLAAAQGAIDSHRRAAMPAGGVLRLQRAASSVGPLLAEVDRLRALVGAIETATEDHDSGRDRCACETCRILRGGAPSPTFEDDPLKMARTMNPEDDQPCPSI